MRQSMEECGFCKEKESKIQKYLDEIEKEKVRECQKALEREIIAKGIQRSRETERRLREMQKLQMMEKKRIQEEEEHVERMWHQMLVDEVRRKEEYERKEFERRQKEMAERRRAYDEQITISNRNRQDALRIEREKENRRLQKMLKKMEQDHYEAIKRKKDEQRANRVNFIEGHEMKLSRLRTEKLRDKAIDDQTIQVALKQLQEERQRKKNEMLKLQIEKEVFVKNYNRERKVATALEEEADEIAQEWKHKEEAIADDFVRSVEAEKKMNRKKAAEEYRRHIEQRNQSLERERKERLEKMERVKRTAFKELQRQLDNANDELRRQIEYKNCLNDQIVENQRVMEAQLYDIERQQEPFTRKSEMFKDAMENRVARSPGRTRTNPVHPFRKLVEKREADTSVIHLPLIGNNVYKI